MYEYFCFAATPVFLLMAPKTLIYCICSRNFSPRLVCWILKLPLTSPFTERAGLYIPVCVHKLKNTIGIFLSTALYNACPKMYATHFLLCLAQLLLLLLLLSSLLSDTPFCSCSHRHTTPKEHTLIHSTHHTPMPMGRTHRLAYIHTRTQAHIAAHRQWANWFLGRWRKRQNDERCRLNDVGWLGDRVIFGWFMVWSAGSGSHR